MMMTMWLALATARKRFATLTEPTWYYRRHKGNMSGRKKMTRRDHELRAEAMAEYAERYPPLEPWIEAFG